jgi:2-alkenal reductase
MRVRVRLGARPRAGGMGCALAAATLALAGCGLGDGEEEPSSEAGPREVGTTRVQIVQGLGRKGRFDPAQIYKRLSPGVVTVISIFDGNIPLPGEDGAAGLGSGFVLNGEGYVATNAHVVTTGQEPRTKRAKEVFVEFSDGNRVPARIVGTDSNSDVALLKIDPRGLSLTPLELGSSKDLAVGTPVAAIGSPFGERQSLSVGVISALDRTIESLTAFSIGNAIQTDAAVNQGNSGGPLLNARGEVIGINSQIKSTGGGSEGVGFAVPVDTVRRSLRQLRKDGEVDYGYLGVSTLPLYPQLARRLGLPGRSGAVVVEVVDDSPAADAGIEAGDEKIEFQGQRDVPTDGDVIVGVDGRQLTRRDDLADLISLKDAGETVRLELLRDDERRTVEVKLEQRPRRAPRG